MLCMQGLVEMVGIAVHIQNIRLESEPVYPMCTEQPINPFCHSLDNRKDHRLFPLRKPTTVPAFQFGGRLWVRRLPLCMRTSGTSERGEWRVPGQQIIGW